MLREKKYSLIFILILYENYAKCCKQLFTELILSKCILLMMSGV